MAQDLLSLFYIPSKFGLARNCNSNGPFVRPEPWLEWPGNGFGGSSMKKTMLFAAAIAFGLSGAAFAQGAGGGGGAGGAGGGAGAGGGGGAGSSSGEASSQAVSPNGTTSGSVGNAGTTNGMSTRAPNGQPAGAAAGGVRPGTQMEKR
jgi:hypothetical protein